MKNENNIFLQTGNAPNFQGDNVTLCTCMHHMRCFLNPPEWENEVWIAGLSGSEFSKGHNYLFYLMKILRAYTSQADLWYSNETTDKDRGKKSTNENVLGDLYVPINDLIKDKINPLEYIEPIEGHSHHQNKDDNTWKSDINYYHGTYKKHQSFLLGDPYNSYIWEKPKIKVEFKNEDNTAIYHPRIKKYESLDSFFEILK